MDVDSFWELIERSRQATSDPRSRRRWLERQLARQPAAEIVDFEILLGQARQRADTMELYGACYRILDGHDSLDGFFYFQNWLVVLGRHAFEQAVTDPDSLADVPEVLRLVGRPLDDWADNDWPDGEWLSSAAFQAYQQVTGEQGTIYDAVEARGHRVRALPAPTGEPWDWDDPAAAARRLPRLSWMFPLTDRSPRRGRRGREVLDRLLAERGQTEEEFITEFLGRGARPQDPSDQT